MSEPDRAAEEARIRAEIGAQPHEPLLPIEKKLIGWSLGTGLVLLVVLYFLSRSFPVTTG
jgi:hypothetical protein